MQPSTPILLALILIPTLSAQPTRFGLPACATPDQELADRTFFVLCHSTAYKAPLWVAYELKPQHLDGASPRPTRFRPDDALMHPGALDSDYRHSGYSRGHLAPAGDFAWSPTAIRATFLLSNAAPQHQSVNAGPWARLEHLVRRLAADAQAAYVISGPLFESEPEFIGPGHVAVPSHFYKVVLFDQGEHRVTLAAIIPNTPTPGVKLPSFFTTVDDVERRTRLDFFSALPVGEQQTLEAQRTAP